MVQIKAHKEALLLAMPSSDNLPTYQKETEVPQKSLLSLGQDTEFHTYSIVRNLILWLEKPFSPKLDDPKSPPTRTTAVDKPRDIYRNLCRYPSQPPHKFLVCLVSLVDRRVPKYLCPSLFQLSSFSSGTQDQ
jgi:hypothetical protein